MNVDEVLVNADWPKRTCDWPLPELGQCDERPVVTAAGVVYTGGGGMVCLYPKPEEAAAIARLGGQPPEELHVTMLFYPEGVPQEMYEFLDRAEITKLEGKIGGVGRFSDNGSGEPVIALPDVPYLELIRGFITDAGIYGWSDEHGWVPHMTLGFGEVENPEGAVGLPVTFDHISIMDNGERRDFPLVAPK